MRDLPAGTVTFLFTDVEGSTKLLDEFGSRCSEALLEHRRVLRDAFARHGGVEVDTQGDASFVAFADGAEAVAAAREAQDALVAGPIRVRIGLHTGQPELTREGYVGQDVHLGARVAASGNGGQVLLSKETRILTGIGAKSSLSSRSRGVPAARPDARCQRYFLRGFLPLLTTRLTLPRLGELSTELLPA